MNAQPLPCPLRGIVPPLATPLRERDVLDHAGLERLLEHVLAGGVAAVFVLGTTGEGPALTYRLRYELVERTCEVVAGRVPVLVGITDTSLGESLALAQFAAGAGAAAVVAAPPYYFPCTPADVTAYFTALAGAVPLPLLLYNIPICTRVAIELDTVRACLELPNVAGIKDSGGDVDNFRALLRLRSQRPQWTVLMGPEHLTAEAVAFGGDGGVNGGANVHPRLFTELCAAAQRRDSERVAALQSQVHQLGALYQHGAPVAGVIRGIKCALALLGLCQDIVAEPMSPVGPAERGAVERCLRELGLLPEVPAVAR
jgi:dihydrodipicolinate synthase/N-acetylneuraminate lyase